MFAKLQINIDLVTTEAFCLNTSPKKKKRKKKKRAQVSILFFSAHKNFMMK